MKLFENIEKVVKDLEGMDFLKGHTETISRQMNEHINVFMLAYTWFTENTPEDVILCQNLEGFSYKYWFEKKQEKVRLPTGKEDIIGRLDRIESLLKTVDEIPQLIKEIKGKIE